MRLRMGLAGAAVLWLLGAGAPGALAADICSDWFHLSWSYKDTNLYDVRARDECVRDVTAQTSRAGYKYAINGDSIGFWFENDVVVVRCMSRTLVTLFAYDYRNQACSLLNQIGNTLRRQ